MSAEPITAISPALADVIPRNADGTLVAGTWLYCVRGPHDMDPLRWQWFKGFVADGTPGSVPVKVEIRTTPVPEAPKVALPPIWQGTPAWQIYGVPGAADGTVMLGRVSVTGTLWNAYVWNVAMVESFGPFKSVEEAKAAVEQRVGEILATAKAP